MKTHFSCFHNLYSITQWQFCNIAKIVGPKSQALSHPTGHSLSLSFFFFFPFLLYFSFFLSLFFFIYSSLCSSSEQKAHTHRPLTPVTHTPVTHTLTTHTPTQVERSSASIFDHMSKSSTMRSFSSLLLSYSFFDLAGASKSAFTATMDLIWKRFDLEARSSIWKLCCRRWEQLRWKLVFYLEVIYLFIFFVVYHK